MRVSRLILILLLVMASASTVFAGSHSHPPKDGRAKTQHVRGYTTKNGKHVKPYNRRPPK